MPIEILEEAAKEAMDAAEWYEQECEGLGFEFYYAVEAAFDVIEDNVLPLAPFSNNPALKDVKRLILRKFPFDIVVLERPSKKIIIAVAHQARKPGYWKDRLKA